MIERRTPLFKLLFLPLAALVVVMGIGIFRVGAPPAIEVRAGAPIIGKRTAVNVMVSEPGRGLSIVKIELAQGDRSQTLAEKSYRPLPVLAFWGERSARDEIMCYAGRESVPWLREGNAILRVTAGRAGTWFRSPGPAVRELSFAVRLTPPTLHPLSAQTYVAQGGCELVVYRVGESSIRDGVQSGAWWFPGHPVPGGGKQDRFAIFAIPYDMNQPDARLVAIDAAGNQAEAQFIDRFFPRPIKTDTIDLTQPFIGKVVPEIMSHVPNLTDRGSLLDNFIQINRDLRQQNAEELRQFAAKSEGRFLWSKPFLMMPNAKVMSAFADGRTYRYGGSEVDRQDHLGFDLAVTRHAAVPAANDGIVVYARYFGIYGNTVILDHGYGLMSLYGHLSSLNVEEGQPVQRGEIIGATGETGLAGGDHLHYATLLQGLPVNPLEWWDGHWIADRIARKLGPAFAFSPR